jgi:hypothetical protein
VADECWEGDTFPLHSLHVNLVVRVNKCRERCG